MVEDICPGKMMLLHGIYNNILIYHSSYPGVYKDKSKNKISTKILISVVETK